MKLGKFIIFLSILGNIFLVIYRQSDDKGLRRWWRSFKIEALVSPIASGLIPNSTEAIEPYGTNSNPSIERIERPLKISGGDQSKFGPGARAKADARAAAKANEMSTNAGKGRTGPFVDGFTPNPIRHRRNNSLHYRVYQKANGVRFELEMKHSQTKSVQDSLFNNQLETFEHRLTIKYYKYSERFLTLDNVYTYWLLDFKRK